ncbi:hypothetical protein DES53_11383 [Roseimicrobium gellanilyticum]|uniref:Lipoprotein n=1 Tax=Roseimicrobium gellanilyticum TaxID=748857 RepID=A0A366H8L0_9BACT|nr:hypothetical protein [Roseimicrobium gellanilyticum]RBP37701.1 hypothetical protein DES53_11383 [Roseimicrobium gellanilyticum]
MKFHACLAVAFALTLCSCSSLPESTVSIEQYKAWEYGPPLKARQFRITAHLEKENGELTEFGTVTAKAGRVVVVNATREFIYPTEFDLPETLRPEEGQGDGSKSGAFPVTPSTPKAFATRDIGDVLKISAKPKGAFLELQGSLSTTSASLTSRSRAEAVSPISDAKKQCILTDNKVLQPEFKTTESLIYSAGLPTSEHRIALQDGKSTLVVKCEVVR